MEFPKDLSGVPFNQFSAADQVQYLLDYMQDRFGNISSNPVGLLTVMESAPQNKSVPLLFSKVKEAFTEQGLHSFFSDNKDKEERGIDIIPQGQEGSFSWRDLLELFREKIQDTALPELDKQSALEQVQGIEDDFNALFRKMPRIEALVNKLQPPSQEVGKG